MEAATRIDTEWIRTDGRSAVVPTTLVDLLRAAAEREPERRTYTFLVDGENEEVSVTNAELDRQARAIAAMLQARGAAGQRALLLYAPGLDYIAAFFGCLYAGVVAVPAYPPDSSRLARTLPRLQAIVADARATIALTSSPLLALAEALSAQAPDLAALRWLATDQLTTEEESWCDPGVTADTLAFLQYTSGSTGTPKGVMLSHGNLIHNETDDRARLRTRPAYRAGRLAAPLPRHGPDREHAAAALRGRLLHPYVADRLPPAPVPLAAGDLALPRDHQRRPELRLRPLRPEDRARRARYARPRVLEPGRQRCGASPRRDDRSLRNRVRGRRLPSERLLPLLRPRRGHPDRVGWPEGGRPGDTLSRSKRARTGSLRGGARRRRPIVRRLWQGAPRSTDRDRAPRKPGAGGE